MGKMRRGTCPECGIVLSARESSIGSVVRCKGCGAKLHLSEPEEEGGEKKPPSTLAAGCGGLVVLLLLFVACGYGLNFLRDQRQKVLDEIAAAHKSYEKGDKAQAVAAYKARYTAALEEDKGKIIQRVAEHEAEQGDEAEARKWIETGLKAKLAIAYQGPAAKIHAAAKKQHDDEAARKKAEEDARLAERRKGQDLQEGKAVARKYIEGRLKDINARVTEASDPVSNGEQWFVTGKLRDDGHPRGGVGWRVTLNRAPDASAPGRSIWTPVEGEVFPP
jgi:hypothetical protein